ncbi:MAG: RICIN domain-containing protein [Kiritimatiellae bacterium]|nr:RICIN domain-containing protein [Kiritimatiellia bacterium]
MEESADGETWSKLADLDESKISSSEYASFSYALSGESRYVRWTYANKYGFNFGLNNVAISSGGPAEFSVTFDKENWFKVALGEASSVTAIPKNGIEPYTFLWESDTLELNGGTTDTLQIPDTLEEGDYTVACLVTEDNGEGDAINALIGFTVEAIPVITGDAFALVTSSDELQDGARYLVTDVTHSFAMSSKAVSSALSAVEVTESEGVITATDESTIWTLVEDSDGNFALQNGEKYVGWSSGNAATMQDAAFANKISVVEGVATITAVSDSTRNLKYNKGSPRFAYYTSAQTDLALFKEAGEASLSVSLDKANGFTVDLGTADSIKASAKNGTEPYSYVWTSDTSDLNGTGDTLAIPATLAEGDYTVQVEVTDADSNKASKQIGFSVVAPLEPHAINIAVGIQNGTVTSDPEGEAVKGTQVKLTATATTEGYALKEMTVTYGETVLTFTSSPATFEMPDEAVSVGAVFAEVKDYATLPFIAEDTPYTGPWQKATIDGLTSKGLGTDYTSGGAVGAKFDTTGDWMQIKFDGTPGELVYAIKGNSISETNNSTFLVQESATGAEDAWNTLATYQTEDGTLTTSQETKTNALAADSRFVRFIYDTKGAGNVGIYGVYISSGGPATFSIKLDPASYFEVEVGEEASIAATPKNAEGEVHYEWTVGGEPAGGDSAVLGLDTTAATDEIEVVCKATDAANTIATAKVSYKVVAPAVKYPVTVASGIVNGTVTVDVEAAAEGDTVTVTATPAAGYKLDKITVNGEAIGGNTFVMGAAAAEVSATFVESVGVTYTRIESMDDFEADAEYLVVAYKKDAFSSALKNELTGKRIALEEVEIVDNTVTTDDDSIVWTISAGAEGKYTLYNAAKGVYAAAPSGATANEAQLVSDGTAELAQWSISVAEEDPLVTIGSAHEGRALQRNSSATYAYFANYANGAKPYLFKKGGTAKLSVGFDKSNGFTVPLGEASSITATAKNGQEPYTYVWDGDLEGEGATLAIPATLAAKDYTVQVTVTDGAGDKVSKQIGFTVQAPVEKYAITVERVPGGTLAVDKDEAEAGETVTVTATPDAGMKLESITVNGTPISGKTFPMPAEAVTVSGTFVEITGETYTRVESADDFVAGAEYLIVAYSKDKFTSALKNEASGKRVAVEEVVINEDNTVVTDSDALVWTIAAGAEGKYTIYNAKAGVYVAAPEKADANEAQLLDDGTGDLAQWTLDFEAAPLVTIGSVHEGKALQRNSTAANAYFANYAKATKPYLFKKAGPAKFSITLEPAAYFEVNVGATGVAVTATPKNAAEGAVEYAWSIGGTPVDATGAVLTLDTSKATEVLEVVCTATDAVGATATAKVSYKVVAAPVAPVVTCNLGESVSGSVGDEFEFVFTAENFTVVADGWWATVNGGDEEALVASDDNQSATFTWAPEADGEYTIVAMAFDENDAPYTCTVTATIGAGGPEIGGKDVPISGFSNKKFTGSVSEEMAAEYTGARLDYATALVGTEWNWSEDKVVKNAAAWPNLDFDYESLDLKYVVFRLVFIK